MMSHEGWHTEITYRRTFTKVHEVWHTQERSREFMRFDVLKSVHDGWCTQELSWGRSHSKPRKPSWYLTKVLNPRDTSWVRETSWNILTTWDPVKHLDYVSPHETSRPLFDLRETSWNCMKPCDTSWLLLLDYMSLRETSWYFWTMWALVIPLDSFKPREPPWLGEATHHETADGTWLCLRETLRDLLKPR